MTQDFFNANDKLPNLTICVSGAANGQTFSCLITNQIPDLGFLGLTQCFPMWIYEEIPPPSPQLSLF